MQQINLLQSSDKDSQEDVLGKGVLLSAVALLFLLGSVAINDYFQIRESSESLVQLENEKAALAKKVSELEELAKPVDPDGQLQIQIRQREYDVLVRKNLVDILKRQEVNRNARFSDFLNGLASQHIDGLWLTYIGIHHGGRTVSMEGATYQPELIPKYLNNLKTEAAFSGQQFKLFSLEETEDDRLLNFTLLADHSDG